MGATHRSGVFIKFLVYLVIVVLVNVAAVTLFFRVDLTENQLYSISEASRHVVSTLSEPLTIHVFFTRDLPAPYNNVERYLRDLLEEYGVYADRYFNYRFYDVSPEEGDISAEGKQNRQLAQDYGIHPVQIQLIEEDEVKFRKAYMGLVIIHGDLIERIPTITSTDGLEYKLTTAIQKLNNKVSALLRLQEKIQVELVLSSSLKAVAPYMGLEELPQLPEKIKEIVETINDNVFGKLSYTYVDPTTDSNAASELADTEVMRLKWPDLENGKVPAGTGMIGLLMRHGDQQVQIPLMNVIRVPLLGTQYELVELEDLDEIINKNLETLVAINEEIGYLADHGAPQLWGGRGPMGGGDPNALNNFRTLVNQTYSLKSLRLQDSDIPRNLNCMVIAGPTEPFTDYELYQIDQFLMQGKSLAVFLDTFQEAPQPQQMGRRAPAGFVPVNTGLEDLLAHYGVTAEKAIVLDENCYRQQLPARFGGGEQALYFAPIIQNEFINHDLDFMKNIKGLVTLQVSPLNVHEDRIEEQGIRTTRLFSSSDESWKMQGRIDLNPMTMRPPGDRSRMESMPLAYVLEGEFSSYFEGKPIPVKEVKKEDPEGAGEDDAAEAQQAGETEGPAPESVSEKAQEESEAAKIEGERAFVAKGKPGRIFLVGSSQILRDNILDTEGKGPNPVFVMNVLDYLNDRDDIAVMRSKEQRFNPLVETSAASKVFVKAFNIAGLPVLVVLIGLAFWARRHSRQRRIQMMFRK